MKMLFAAVHESSGERGCSAISLRKNDVIAIKHDNRRSTPIKAPQ